MQEGLQRVGEAGVYSASSYFHQPHAIVVFMSKITCPDCKKRIEHATSGCPICGFHIEGWWHRVGQRKHFAWQQRVRRRWALATSALLMVTLTALAKPVNALHPLFDDSPVDVIVLQDTGEDA